MKRMLRGCLVFMVLHAVVGLASCTDGAGHEEAADLSATRAAWTSPIRWSARDGAQSYRIRAWSGDRLLFEETRTAAWLELTPALRRAMAPMEQVVFEVEALDAFGDPLAELQRVVAQRAES